jgi:hypothetical protein
MSPELDLSVLNPKRYFVFGDIFGNYDQFIDILYEQNFNKDDVLISTGNTVDLNKEKSMDCLYFIMNCPNTYTIQGEREFDILKTASLPEWVEFEEKVGILKYLNELPQTIKINDSMCITKNGIEPNPCEFNLKCSNDKLRCLIIYKGEEPPILIES